MAASKLAGVDSSKHQRKLNNMTPGARDVRLGDLVNDVLTAHNYLARRLNSHCMSKAGLAIKAGSSTLVKAATAFVANAAGVFVRKAANTDMPALVGVLATAKSAAWAFYIDSAGTLTTSAKTADAASHDAALALVPPPPDDLAQIGILVLDNATGSDFTGGTTALDTASLTATYYDTTGPVAVGQTLANSAVNLLTLTQR